MAFPRLCAIAEIGWTGPRGEYADFRQRLETHLMRLAAMDIMFRYPGRDQDPPLATWDTGMLQASSDGVLRFKLPANLEAGTYDVRFIYQSGSHGLTVKSAQFVVNGDEQEADTHDGFAGGRTTNNVYRVSFPTRRSLVQQLELKVVAHGEGGTDSSGYIELTKIEE
jgi:hypothetical protein